MDLQWNLNNLYTSFDSEEFKKDFERFICKLDEIGVFTNDLDINHAEKLIIYYINSMNNIESLYMRLNSYASLRYYANTYDTVALNFVEKLKKSFSKLAITKKCFQQFLAQIDNLDNIIKASDTLKKHRFIINELKETSKYILTEKEEEMFELMKSTGSDSWELLRQTLTSTLFVDYEENGQIKKVPLGIAKNKVLFDKDADIRKKAYEAEINSYKKIDKSIASTLNGIKGEVITISKKRGYNSPLEMTLINSRMDKSTLDVLMSSVCEYLPYFHEYLKRKAGLLGHKHGLPYYDLFAPIGEINLNYTYKEASQLIIKTFTSFSEKLGSFAKKAIENNWIDVEPRDGKWNHGAFCWQIHPIKESRILCNFIGTLDNVRSLAHELGHAYHNECLNNQSMLNSDYPMPLAETASKFCEQIVLNELIKKASEKEKIILLDQSLTMATFLITDKYSQYLFETELFEKRLQGSLSVEELKEMMVKAQKKTYKDGLIHPYMWLSKNQLYLADNNFYNIPYIFGMLFAKGLYAKYMETGEDFIHKYDDLLLSTGSRNIKDTLEIIDIDAHSPDFFRNSLELIRKEIELFLHYTEGGI